MADERQPDKVPRRVRLPGFIVGDEVGLGDAIKKVTGSLGIRPCGACEQRAAHLNERLIISPWRRP